MLGPAGLEADAARQAALGERDGEAAVRAVVRGAEQPGRVGVEHEPLHARLEVQVDRREAGDEAVARGEVLGAREGLRGLGERRADQQQLVALADREA